MAKRPSDMRKPLPIPRSVSFDNDRLPSDFGDMVSLEKEAIHLGLSFELVKCINGYRIRLWLNKPTCRVVAMVKDSIPEAAFRFALNSIYEKVAIFLMEP